MDTVIILEIVSPAERTRIAASRPASAMTAFGEVTLQYRTDEDGRLFAFAPISLMGGVLAEIDGDTFGALHGVRIYLED